MTFGDTGLRARAASFALLCSKLSCEYGTVRIIVLPATDAPCGRTGSEVPKEVREVPVWPLPLPQAARNTRNRKPDNENHPFFLIARPPLSRGFYSEIATAWKVNDKDNPLHEIRYANLLNVQFCWLIFLYYLHFILR